MKSSGFRSSVVARESARSTSASPVHDSARADIDDEGGCMGLDRLSDLRRPGLPRPEVVFVEPDLEAGLLGLRRGLQPALERPRRLRVGAGMAEENEWRRLRHGSGLGDGRKLRGHCHAYDRRPHLAVSQLTPAAPVFADIRHCSAPREPIPAVAFRTCHGALLGRKPNPRSRRLLEWRLGGRLA
jgi:hypothetical protein